VAAAHLGQQLRSCDAHLWDVQHDWPPPEALPLLLSLLRSSSSTCSCCRQHNDTPQVA
jgi:hypothetical protein